MADSSSDGEVDLLLSRMKSATSPLRKMLQELHSRYLPLTEGKVADYIP